MSSKKRTSARGYGYEHQRMRRALLPFAAGSACTRCGAVINACDAIDLDHNEDRTGYLGWAHSSCNRSAGGRKGNAARNGPARPRSREW